MLRALVFAVLLASPLALASAIPRATSAEASPAENAYGSYNWLHKRQSDDPAPSLVPEVEPSPPSDPVDVYGGVLVCHAGHISDSNPEFYMNRNEAAGAINTFCTRIDPGVIFKPVGGTPFQNVQVDGENSNYTMALAATWIGGDNCPTTDFSNNTNRAVCRESLLHNIIDDCNTLKAGLEYWKGGGTFTKDCIMWSIQRVTSLWP